MSNPLTRHLDAPSNIYEQDYFRWLEQTALHLRKQAFDQLDLENLIEEIEDMGRSEKRAIESCPLASTQVEVPTSAMFR